MRSTAADIQFQRLSRGGQSWESSSLPWMPPTASRVQGLPLTFDPNANDINAFATCTKSGKATIAITDGMLVLTAYLAQLQASDEVLATRHFDEYVVYVAKSQQPNAPVLAPPPQWLPANTRNNPTKVARQQLLNDEMLAFVMGHELGHHYLNHLPCTSILPLDASEIGILLTDAVPAFNQPNEVAADVAGVRNVLAAVSSKVNQPAHRRWRFASDALLPRARSGQSRRSVQLRTFPSTAYGARADQSRPQRRRSVPALGSAGRGKCEIPLSW